MTTHRPSRPPRAALAAGVALALSLGSLVPGATAVALPVSSPAASVAVAVAPAIAPVVAKKKAKKAKKPRISVSKKLRKGTWYKDQAPKRIAYDYRLPSLTGVKAKAKKRFNAKVDRLVRAERRSLMKWRSGGYSPDDVLYPTYKDGSAHFSMRPRVSRYKNYVSATLLFDTNPNIGGVSQQNSPTVTVDARTGRTAKLSRFTRLSTAELKRLAYRSAVREYGADSIWPRSAKEMPKLDSFQVSGTGIRFWFSRYELAAGAYGNTSAFVGWSKLR